MPSYCVVCDFKWTRDSDTSFHKFNFERVDIANKWTEFVRRCKNHQSWKPSRWSSLCNKHFLASDFKIQKGVMRKHLKNDAVPTIEPTHTSISDETTSTRYIPSTPPETSRLLLDPSSTGTQCRLCSQTISTEGVNIFKCGTLKEYTTKYLSHLNILSSDYLPKCVCNSCYHQLEQFDNFSVMAIRSQISLATTFAASVVAASTGHQLIRNSLDSTRVFKIKQEPIVHIKEENHALNVAAVANTEQQQAPTDEFENNLSNLLLNEFYDYGLGNGGHIMEITDLSNDFINLTEDDNNGTDAIPSSSDINIKPNMIAAKNHTGVGSGGGGSMVHLKQEDEFVFDDFCDEDDISKAMISNEHSYCKFNLPQFLDPGNPVWLIKTEKKDEGHSHSAAAPPPPPPSLTHSTAVKQMPPLTIPKIYIIDNALLKHNCLRCGDSFETRPMLDGHLRQVHRNEYQCALCNVNFMDFPAYYFHKLNCTYRRGYLIPPERRIYWRCKHCQMVFKMQLGYKNHVKSQVCSTIMKIRQSNARKRSSRRRMTEKNIVVADKQFACQLCDKIFVRYCNLTQHQLTHSTERAYACHLCDKVFKRTNGLAAHHKSIHLKLRPFECDVCRRRFALKADMRRCRHRLGAEMVP